MLTKELLNTPKGLTKLNWNIPLLFEFYTTINRLIDQSQGWHVCNKAVITAGKNTVITGSSQTTRVVTNCRKPSQTQK